MNEVIRNEEEAPGSSTSSRILGPSLPEAMKRAQLKEAESDDDEIGPPIPANLRQRDDSDEEGEELDDDVGSNKLSNYY